MDFVERRSAGGSPPLRFSRLGRVGVVALDVPSEVAADTLRSMGAEVVVAVPGSRSSELRVLRQRMADCEVDGIIAYTSDWARQSYPALYEVALTALMGGRSWLLADGASERVYQLGGLRTAATFARLVNGGWHTIAQLIAARRELKLPSADAHIPELRQREGVDPASGDWVLVVWHGSPSKEGGAVTHLRGILGGFRAYGYRTALVTAYPVPVAIKPHVDHSVVTEPVRASRRFTRDTARLAVDRQLTDTCHELAAQISPCLVYQRHTYQSVAGMNVARELAVPFVLEWNASEMWVRRNWWLSDPLKSLSRQFEKVAELRETRAVRSAAVVAAVSKIAAQMACGAGATPHSVLVVPNAADMSDIPPPSPLPDRAPGALLGWVGTFGPWHGAEVAVKALVHLPDGLHLLMIGDGERRLDCQRLALELGVNDRVEFTGTLPRANVISRLQACDVLLSPHVPLDDAPFFGSPTKIFDYMAIGRPIVASRLEQIADVLADGRTARLVDPGSDVDLADGIRDVLQSEGRGVAMGMAARLDALHHHRWIMRVEQILDALKEGIDEPA